MNKFITILLLLLLPTTAFACFPVQITLEQRVEHTETIYVGFVTGIHLFQFEKNQSRGSSIAQVPEAHSLRVLVTKVLKGSSNQKIIQPKILNCGSGKAALKDKVIVFFNGEFWYTTKFDQESYLKLVELTQKS